MTDYHNADRLPGKRKKSAESVSTRLIIDTRTGGTAEEITQEVLRMDTAIHAGQSHPLAFNDRR